VTANPLARIGEPTEPDGEVVFEAGIEYRAGEPIRIRVRKRGNFFHLDDGGAAAARAGRPRGWFELIDRLVANEGFNVNRRGVVFVSVGRGRDLAALAVRLAECSRAVYAELLELQTDERLR
jgi:hypothetical protein